VYLTDGIRLHMSWPRPLFYGLFMLPLHLKATVWPVVAVQAVVTAAILHLVIRCFLPGLAAWVLVPVVLVLAACTSLPWFVSQIMPDFFAGLLVLALATLLLVPARLGAAMQVLTILFAAACITMHLSFLPISLAVLVTLLLCRLWLGERVRVSDLLRAAVVPALALAVSTAANAQLTGNVSPSPYGKIFVLTRVLLDGPGQRALQRDCPRPGWTLCAFKDELPRTEDDILFGDQSVVTRAGGYMAVGPQAWPIILSALRAEPGVMLRNALRNTARQFISFRSGDALLVRMVSVDDVWRADLPKAEQDRYRASKQYGLIPLLPVTLQAVHLGVGSVALAVLAVGGVVALRRRKALGGVYAAIAVALGTNAFVSGALSGVFDRYQSRLVWLATFAMLLMLLAWWRRLYRDRIGPAAPA
jgi:hypothetical protein